MSYFSIFGRHAAAAAILASTVLPAAAITDSKFTYSTEQTGFLTISPMDMAPDGDVSASKPWFSAWSGARLTGDGCFQTGVNLPQDARIVEVRVWYSKKIFFELWSARLADGVSAVIVSKSVPGDGSDTRRSYGLPPPAPTTVDNRTRMYGLGLCLAPGQTFNGARIVYKYTSAGD